jgi:hypothetical protein
MQTLETLRLLYAAANDHRRMTMGAYTVGPFTRVEFSYRRDEIVLRAATRPDTAGVAVHVISSTF